MKYERGDRLAWTMADGQTMAGTVERVFLNKITVKRVDGGVAELDVHHKQRQIRKASPEEVLAACEFFGRVGKDWTREVVQTMYGWQRPKVRCRYGSSGDDCRDLWGEIVPDGNNPYVVIPVPDGESTVTAVKFSWPLVLEVLNDLRAAPLWFWKK